jgi:GPH family glycoside/pentoside/hexuronide:cation symporter
VASILALAAALATAGFTLWAVVRLRERDSHQGRGGAHLWLAFRDVLANRHARVLLAVFGLESFGTAILGIVTPFAMDYVLGMPGMTPVFVAIYFVPALAFIPVWIRLSRSVGKRNLWIFSMSMMSIAFCGLFFVGPGDVALVCALGVLAGIGGGCGQVVGPSIQADVIDFDDYRTGERKEGMYFAVWHFVRKSAHGIAAMLTGALLSAVGYEPNAEQGESARLGLRLLFGVVPGGTFALGTLLFLRFRLNEAEHVAIRRELDAR